MNPAQVFLSGLLGLLITGPIAATEFDYDGDGKADVAVRRPDTQYWYVKNSGSADFNSERGDGIQRSRFGLSETDIPVPADYDGDGITDFAVRRQSNYTWYVLNSSGDNTNSEREDGIQRETFGKNANDIPVPADYDGDGIADFAVRRPSTFIWYIKNSSGSNFNSTRGDGIQRIEFGKQVNDTPVKGDFDGDGKADIAVKRAANGYWYILNSSGDNTNSDREDGIQRIQFFTDETDIPVPADYDGDGITDIAYRNPGNFTWYIRSSVDGVTSEIEFGLHPEDIPVPADYDGDGKADLAIRRAGDQTFIIYNPDVIADREHRATALLESEDDSETVSFGSKSGDIPINASTDQVMEKLDDTNSNGNNSNTIPNANAGENQTVTAGSQVILDGSASSDEEGDALTYAWTIRSAPDGSNATLNNSDSVSPTFTADLEGNYIVSLIVNDGTDDSAADRVRISAESGAVNAAPVANAGADQTVDVGTRVELDGSGSFDTDGDSLTYTWSFVALPEGSAATLGRTNIQAPKFTADVAGSYSLQLIVNDGTEDSAADTVTITAEAVITNTTPVAEAGSDQTVNVGDLVSLDGSASSDSDGDNLTYSWQLVSIPGDTDVALTNANTVNPTFTPQIAGAYVISLTVNDGTEDSTADTLTVTAIAVNTPPVANAGGDQAVTVNDSVSLSASGSSDNDDDTLTYSWSFSSKPDNSAASISNSTGVNASFTADAAGSYVVLLTVSDGEDSDSDSVTITASQETVAETDNEALLTSSFDAERFAASADETVAARPYVMVDFIDHDRDGANDAALLQSNGVPFTYDYDYSTSDADNISNTCFDDPNNGPDEADNGGCYAIEASVRAFVIPVAPELATASTSISSDQHSGMAISGATFELPTAPSPEGAGYAITNVYDEGWEVLDDCNGHSGYLGAPYHYHGDPTYPINDGTNEHTVSATEASQCLPDYELIVDTDTGHAPLIGYMADGFPIYGSDGYDFDSANPIDDCNGHSVATAEYPDGVYHYHALNYDAVTENGTGSRREAPPLPECLSGKVWFVPEYHSPELSEPLIGKDVDSEITVESTETTVDALTLATAFAANRFSATSNAEARPYVYVGLIDWDFDGSNDTALLQSNGIPSQYDYDDSTSDSNDIQDVCFDDPQGGPDTGCYALNANSRVFLFSLNPILASSSTAISDNDHTGMAISGATFVHPNEDSPSGEGYAVLNTYDSDWEVLDDCNGNASYQGGPYHYHGDPSNVNRDQVDEHTATAVRAAGCLPDFDSEADDSHGHAQAIGFMADGFLIYGESGYDAGNSLDECNGHTGVTQEFPDGIYHYHAISADTANSEGLAPLPTCLNGMLWYLPNYPAPELSEANP